MDTVDVLIKIWPVLIVLAGILVGIGMHQQRFRQVESDALKLDKYLLIPDHEKVCKINNLEMKGHFDSGLTGLKDETFTEMRKVKDETLKAVDEVKRETIRAIQREFKDMR